MEFDKNSDIIPDLNWNIVNEENQKTQKVRIYYFSLTTCSYCKKGIKWLNEKGLTYSWLYIDKINLETKQAIKKWVQKKYNLSSRMGSPFVIFRTSEKDFISNGFDPDYWGSKAY